MPTNSLISRLSILLITVICCISVTAYARIAISPSIVNFTANGQARKDIIVYNSSDKYPAYIAITPYVIEHPGTSKEKKVHLYNPTKSGILVVPNKLIIPAKQHRFIRIILTKPLGLSDKIYRISVIPKTSALIPEHINKNKVIGIHLIVGYGILAIARPQTSKPKLSFSRHGNELTIKNQGNTNIIIASGKQCEHSKCFKLPSRRMYAGNLWKIKLPYSTPISIKTYLLGKPSTHEIK